MNKQRFPWGKVFQGRYFDKAALLSGQYDAYIRTRKCYNISRETLLLLDISQQDGHYATLALDYYQGLIKTGLTTRQLVQQYLAFGPINLKHVRLLKQMAGIRSTLLPISFGQVQFLPTGGASHGQTDWIGTFHLQHYLESGKKLQVRWGDYLGAELNFRGSFRQGLHDAGMIGELFVKIVHEIAAWGGLETIEVPQCQEFLDCACAFHQQLRLNQTGYFQQFEEQHSRIFSKYLLDETERATPELFEATVNYGLRQIARLENYN